MRLTLAAIIVAVPLLPAALRGLDRPNGWELVSPHHVREVHGLVAPPPSMQGAGGGKDAQGWPPPGVFRIGDPGVTPPRPRRRVEAQYTTSAMRAGIEGAVRLQVVVNANGTVGDVMADRSLDRTHGLDDEAVKAAKQWQFMPGSVKGAPVPVVVWIELTFTLKNQALVPALPEPNFEVHIAEFQPAAGLTEGTLDSRQKIYVGRRLATSSDVIESHVEQDGNKFSIMIEFDEPAATSLFAATVDHVGRPLAIVVDGQVLSAPVVRGPVTNRIKIDGTFTREEAEGVVRELNKQRIRK